MQALPLSQHVTRRRIYSLAKPGAGGDQLLGFGGTETCHSQYRINRKGFPFVVIEMVESGCIEFELDGRCGVIRKGSFLCYGPESHLKFKVSEESGCTKHFMAFQTFAIPEFKNLQHFLELYRGRRVENVPVMTVLKFVNLISELADAYNTWEELRRLVDALLGFLASASQKENAGSPARHSTYRTVTQFISEHFKELKSLNEIADRCGYDKSYLCQLYKRHSDLSPYQQLIQMKVEYACVLLETTEWRIGEIASSLGFDDALHFSRVFKKKTGISPSNFRPMIASLQTRRGGIIPPD